MAEAKSCTPNLTLSGKEAEAGYLQCLQQAKDRVDKAVKAQNGIIEKLTGWKKKIAKAQKKNEEALEKYKEDLAKAKPALEQTKSLMFRANGVVATQAARKFNTATGVSGNDLTNSVNMAANGGAPTLKDYVAINQDLQMEQKRAMVNAADFQKRAQSEISSRKSSLSSLKKMQATLSTEISKAGSVTASSGSKAAGISSTGTLPQKGPILPERPGNQGVIDNTGGSVTGQNTGGNHDMNNGGNGNNSYAAPTNYNRTPAGGSSPNYASLGSAAGGVAAGAGGGNSGSNGGSSTFVPYADGGAGGGPNGNANANGAGGKNPQGYAFGNGGSAGAVGNGQAPGDAGEQGDPAQLAAVESPNGLYYPAAEEGISGAQASGASVNPGSHGGAGAATATGFSASRGAAAGAGDTAKIKEIAPKAQFSPDLDSGAVNIAGSEVNSALAALEEEFKTEDVNLDLDGLTADEKKALSPDGALAGGVFSSPASGGRRIASANQESKAVLDEDSTPLFPRNHGAIERAIKRGDLILGIKKKF